MDNFAKRLARQADHTISRVHNKLQRYLDHDQIARKRALKLTLGKAYEQEWQDLACVFALSTGRTGTQTLAAMLRLSPQVVAQHEPAPRLVKATFDAYMEAQDEGWIEKWTPFMLATRDDFVLEANAKGKVYVESNNRLTYVAPAVMAAFPASKFIFSHRDPYKVIRSGMQRGAYQGPNKAWNFARIRPRKGEPSFTEWASLSPLEKEAWRWAQINQMAHAFFSTVPAERRMELPAATFFSGKPEIYKEIFEFVGVPCPPRSEIEGIMGKKMNAQAHFNGLPFEWTDESLARVRRFIEPTATLLGYNVK